MASLLVYDERLWGSPPWEQVSATCLVNETHSVTSVVNWLKGKCDKYKGLDTLYIMAHGNDGYVQLGKGLAKENAHLFAPLQGKLVTIVVLACLVAQTQKGWAFCSTLAKYSKAIVIAADSVQRYVALPFGILPTSFGSWEGTVHAWGPDGTWLASWED